MSKRSNFTALLLLCCVLLVQLVYGQAKKDSPKNLPEQHDWSLQFQVSDNFTLKSFDGAFFAAKRQLSAHGAIRFGFDISYSNQDSESEREESGSFYKSNSDNKSFSANLNCLYLYYPVENQAVKYFIGAGPQFGYQKSDNEQKDYISYEDSLTSTNTDKQKMDGHSWGIQLVSGVEWFVKSNISLHAEYFASALYVKGKTTLEAVFGSGESRILKSENDGFRFEKGGVRFGVSVYF